MNAFAFANQPSNPVVTAPYFPQPNTTATAAPIVGYGFPQTLWGAGIGYAAANRGEIARRVNGSIGHPWDNPQKALLLWGAFGALMAVFGYVKVRK